jgi:hypothetical protein
VAIDVLKWAMDKTRRQAKMEQKKAEMELERGMESEQEKSKL